MGNKKTPGLKQLEARRHSIASRLEDAVTEKHALNEQLKTLDREIAHARAGCKLPTISDHALLQYLIKVKGIDMEQLRSEILTPDVVGSVQALRSGKFPSGAGFHVVVKNNVVVTVETRCARTPQHN